MYIKLQKGEIMTLRDVILKSTQELISKGKNEFTPEEVFQIAKKLNPKVKRPSILGSMTSLLVTIPSSSYPPEKRFLERVRFGVYKLHESKPEKEIKSKKKKKPKTPSKKPSDGFDLDKLTKYF